MRNLAVHNVEESDHLRATTGTVEVPTKRDRPNDAALVPTIGARPIQQHELIIASHNIQSVIYLLYFSHNRPYRQLL